MSRPFDQLPGESVKAYDAFRAYLEMGRGRTVCDAYRQKASKPAAKQAPGYWNAWVKEFSWESRARAFDQWVDSQKEEKYAAAWETHRDRLIDQAKRLADRADQMLKHPLIEQKIEKTVTAKSGEQIPTVTIIKPAKWTFSDVPRTYQVSNELMKAGTGEVDAAIELLERNGYVVMFKDETSQQA